MEPIPPPIPSRLHSVRDAFVTGLLLVAPLVVTVWALSKLIDLVGGTFSPVLFFYIPEGIRIQPGFSILWNILGTIVAFAMVTILGYASNYFFGKYFGAIAERAIEKIPGVGSLYNTVKQVVGTFGSHGRPAFNKVVLVEFPRPGSWSIGFLAGEPRGEIGVRLSDDRVGVFIPTTPNPTSGFLIYVLRSEVIELEMNVGDGMKMIISGGSVAPPWPPHPAHLPVGK